MSAWEIIFQILLVFAPHVGYVAQYIVIIRTNSIDGYAPLVSLILLSSNTLRLYYYIGKRYMLALLFQAILGVIVHFMVLLKVLRVHANQAVSSYQNVTLFGGNAIPAAPIGDSYGAEFAGGKPAPAVADAQESSHLPSPAQPDTILAEEAGASSSPVAAAFYRFLRFLFYIQDTIELHLLRLTPHKFTASYVASACVALVVIFLYYISIGFVWKSAPEVVGYISLGLEALLVLPQILRNVRRRSTEGLSMILILTWVGGDVIKVIYYIYAKQALPFIVCGFFQILLDVVVVAQVVYYRFYLRREGGTNDGGDAGTTHGELSP